MNIEDYSVSITMSNIDYSRNTFIDSRDTETVIIHKELFQLQDYINDCFKNELLDLYQVRVSLGPEKNALVRVSSGINSSKFFQITFSFSIYINNNSSIFYKPMSYSRELFCKKDVLKFILIWLVNII